MSDIKTRLAEIVGMLLAQQYIDKNPMRADTEIVRLEVCYHGFEPNTVPVHYLTEGGYQHRIETMGDVRNMSPIAPPAIILHLGKFEEWRLTPVSRSYFMLYHFTINTLFLAT